jgi:signal transduction histidine kinase
MRLESDGSVTILAADSALPLVAGVGERVMPGAGTAVACVLSTGRPARIEGYDGAAGSASERMRNLGYGGSVGAPVVVDGRVWGVMVASWAEARAMPSGGEERLVQFTELVATAIANAQAKAELTASRARIVATADDTRRRIERDLHDGAQQRLVSLALQLRAARAAIPPDLGELAAELDGVAAGLNGVLDELREFARGIHPAILSEGGLAPALRTLARRSAVPVALTVRAEGRLPEPIEVGAYYVVSEALANAAKHSEASSAAVDVEAVDGVLRVAVRDDGVGGADFAHGSGLVGLRDRVEALGGRISVESQRGAGTSVEVELPLTPDAAVAFR